MLVGPTLALSWLTVLPVRGPATVDRDAARRAIAWAPFAGIALGVVAALALWASTSAGLTAPLAGTVVVGALALATRGMHVDGLADTADGLGCYGPPERAREIMRSGSAGPFGVAAIAVVLGIQALSFGQLSQQNGWAAVALAVTVSRVAVVPACRRGVAAAPGSGFGALVADSQSRVVIGGWCAAALVLAVVAVDDRPWQGPMVVVVVLIASAVFVRHCVRRFGGLSGDILGAVVETTTAATAVGFLLGS